MAKHTVTTPTPGWSGDRAGVHFAKGVATGVDDTDDKQARALAYFRRRGYTVTPEAAPDPAGAGEQKPEPAPRPTRSASKVDWVTYAASHGGMAQDDAEAATRDQLAERFLGPKED